LDSLFQVLKLAQFSVESQWNSYRWMALVKLFTLVFGYVTIGPGAQPPSQDKQLATLARPLVLSLNSIDLRPNDQSDPLALKTLSIERSKSYRTVYELLKIAATRAS
jgi:hypothetical protein